MLSEYQPKFAKYICKYPVLEVQPAGMHEVRIFMVTVLSF